MADGISPYGHILTEAIVLEDSPRRKTGAEAHSDHIFKDSRKDHVSIRYNGC
jgi:hypothetical protein